MGAITIPTSGSGSAIDIYEAGSSIVTAATRLDFKDGNVENPSGTIASYYLDIAGIDHGRLTTQTGVPVSTSDRTSQGTLYYTPYGGNNVALYDGTRWKLYEFTECSLSLTLTSGKTYDVFLYDNSGTLTLELSSAWTNDTTRADALALQDGVYCKSGALTRRLVGMIRASGTNVTEDSDLCRYVSSYKNRVHRRLFSCPAYNNDNNWSYYNHTSTTWSAVNGGTGASLKFLAWGDSPAEFDFTFHSMIDNPVSQHLSPGIGLDSTSAALVTALNNVGYRYNPTIRLIDVGLSAGYHYLAMLGNVTSGTGTFWSDGARYGASADPYVTYGIGWVLA